MVGSYNAQLIYLIGYSRRRCGATTALIKQPQIQTHTHTHTHNEEPEILNRILWEGIRFLGKMDEVCQKFCLIYFDAQIRKFLTIENFQETIL